MYIFDVTAAISMTFSTIKTSKFRFNPQNNILFISLSLILIYLPKWLIKSKNRMNCGILGYFWLFWGDFWCFSNDYRPFSKKNRIFKKIAATRAPKMIKTSFYAVYRPKTLKVDVYQKTSKRPESRGGIWTPPTPLGQMYKYFDLGQARVEIWIVIYIMRNMGSVI